jgi:hypothetical protein
MRMSILRPPIRRVSEPGKSAIREAHMARQITHFQLLQIFAGVVLAESNGAFFDSSHFFCTIVREALGVLLPVIWNLGQAWLFCALGHQPAGEYVIQFGGAFWRLLAAVFGAM